MEARAFSKNITFLELKKALTFWDPMNKIDTKIVCKWTVVLFISFYYK